MGQARFRPGGGQGPDGDTTGCARACPGCASEGPDGGAASRARPGARAYSGQARHATTPAAATAGEVAIARCSWSATATTPAIATGEIRSLGRHPLTVVGLGGNIRALLAGYACRQAGT
jgi:hypothetical protein